VPFREEFVLKTATALTILVGFLAAPGACAAEKLTLLYAPTTGLMPSYVAKDQGIFEKHGLDVTLTLLTNQGAVIQALMAGTAEIVTPSALAVIQANGEGLDVVFVASSSMSPSASRTGVFAKNGSGLKNAHDLIGKKVGVPSLNTLIHITTRRWLKEQGVDYNEVNFAEVGFQQMADVLNAGIIDAGYAIEPYYERVAEIGYVIGNPDATLPKGTLTSVYATTRAWADGHRATLKAFRDSLTDAIAYIDKNEASARASLAKYTRQKPEVVATATMPLLEVYVRPQQVQFFIDLARDQGLMKSSPDAAQMIAP
jgi:NitT/TauT family transport system substrate-binding protein